MQNQQPNIILIMTDQQRTDTICSHGNDHMITPGMDEIVNNGTSFRNAFAPGATCIASRAAVFTGMFPHNSGVYSFDDWSHHKSWVDQLRDNGYYCANVGKMHVSPRDDMMSFHERIVVENPTSNFLGSGAADDAWGTHLSMHGTKRPLDRHKSDDRWGDKFQAVPWHMDEKLHSDVFIGDSALAWIDRYESDKPFMLQVGFTGPHEPYDPLPRHLELYEDKVLPEPIKVSDTADSTPLQHRAHEYYFKHNDHESTIDLKKASHEDIMTMRRHYYANVTTVDEKIQEILQKLRNKGLLDNAVVILTSDHGDMLGDYSMPYKWLMYDSITRVPLVIWDTRKNEKRDVHELVSLMDIGPTVLSYAGIDIPNYLEGTNLQNIVEDDCNDKIHEAVYCEDNYLTMVRTDDYKMIYYTFQEDEGELYDLKKDPDEVKNLFHEPDYEGVRVKMEGLLLKWLLRSNYETSYYKTKEFGKERILDPRKNHYLHPGFRRGDFGYKV